MRARYARRIREGVRWGRGAAALAIALQQPPQALLDHDVPTTDELVARGYRRGVRSVVNGREPRLYRRTYRSVAVA